MKNLGTKVVVAALATGVLLYLFRDKIFKKKTETGEQLTEESPSSSGGYAPSESSALPVAQVGTAITPVPVVPVSPQPVLGSVSAPKQVRRKVPISTLDIGRDAVKAVKQRIAKKKEKRLERKSKRQG